MLMKNIYTFIILIVISTFSYSQIVSNDVVSSGGNSFIQPNLTMDWTLGDLSVETYSINNIILTQGFQQGNLMLTKIEDHIPFGSKIKVYPNPTKSIVNIETADFDKSLYYELLNQNGKMIKTANLKTNKDVVDLSAYANGLYYLNIISDTDKKARQVFKIQKIK